MTGSIHRRLQRIETLLGPDPQSVESQRYKRVRERAVRVCDFVDSDPELLDALYDALGAEASHDPTERERAGERWAAFKQLLREKAAASGDAELMAAVQPKQEKGI